MIMHDVLLRGIVKLIMALTQLSFSSSNDVAIKQFTSVRKYLFICPAVTLPVTQQRDCGLSNMKFWAYY